MKKILAIAVATAISAPAMADLTIGGSAEYNLKDIDGVTTTELETNLDVSASSTSESGVTLAVFTQLEATEAAENSLDVDDMYMTIGNEAATLHLGDFGTSSAYASGADMAAPTPNQTAFKANSKDDPNDSIDAAVTFTGIEGVTVQVATTFDSADSAAVTRAYVSTTVGGVALAANVQDVEGDAADSGYALSASTTFEGVAVGVSYAANDDDSKKTTTLTASYSGLSLATETTDAGANDSTIFYGAYTIGDLGIPGATVTVGAGGGDTAGDVVAARIAYAF
jgi:hypothetical protein